MFGPAKDTRDTELLKAIVQRRLLLEPINVEHFLHWLERLEKIIFYSLI